MTEIEELPAGWAAAIFDDLLDYVQPTEYIVASTDYDNNYATPVLTPGKSFIIGYTNETTGIFNALPVIIFDDFTTATKFVNFPFKVKSSAMKILTPTCSLVNIKYAFYFMQTIQMNTDTHKRYWISVYSKKQIPLAPQNEQARIVAKIEELFSEIDKGVENFTTAREQLRVYRQALLKYAFEGRLTEQWRNANADKLETAEQLFDRITAEREKQYQEQVAEWEASGRQGSKPKAPKQMPPITAKELSELPVLPEGWGWFKVAHICDVVRGGSPRPAGDPKFYGGNIPFLKVADITNTSTPYLSSFTFTITEAGLSKTRQIKPNTLLLSNSGATLGVPKICLISATMNDGVAAFLGLPHETLLYHYYFWQSKTAYLRNIDQGAAQPNLNTEIIKEIIIPICCPSEQLKIAQELEAAMSEVDQLELSITTSLQQADALRQSILTKAFSGQLVLQDPNDEPASMLLERIRAEREAEQQEEKRGVRKKGKRIKEVITLADLMEVLKTKNDWISAQEAFRRCGIADGSGTDDIEKIYVELREHVKTKRVEVKRRGNEDWLRMAQGV